MEEQWTNSALGSKPRKQLNALQSFNLEVKPEVKRKSLEKVLEELPEAELKQLQRYASMILRSASPYSGYYYQKVKRMHPPIDVTKPQLSAAVLQRI